jgi:hypothetical protein
VFATNLIGCVLAAAFFVYTAALPAEVATAMAEISRHAVSAGAGENFMRAIPAGVLIAALVWMTSSGDHENFLIIFVFTWLIAAGDLNCPGFAGERFVLRFRRPYRLLEAVQGGAARLRLVGCSRLS